MSTRARVPILTTNTIIRQHVKHVLSTDVGAPFTLDTLIGDRMLARTLVLVFILYTHDQLTAGTGLDMLTTTGGTNYWATGSNWAIILLELCIYF